jgi:hypothetical protein
MTEPRKNAVYAHRHPRGKSQTSARALKLNERRHKAYQLALAGKPLYAIAEQLGCAPSTAHEDISKRAEEVCPKVTAQQQLQKSLARLEQQYEVLHPQVLNGDIAAIKEARANVETAARLCGLLNSSGSLQVNVQNNIGNGAEDGGITVRFVPSPLSDAPRDTLDITPRPAAHALPPPPARPPKHHAPVIDSTEEGFHRPLVEEIKPAGRMLKNHQASPMPTSPHGMMARPPDGPATEYDIPDNPDTVPWHRRKVTGQLRRGPLVWGGPKKPHDWMR